jgi:hypothetical protein
MTFLSENQQRFLLYYVYVDIEFHLDGIRKNEVAVIRIPHELYDKTAVDYKKNPKSELFSSLRIRSYMSVQNIMRHDTLKRKSGIHTNRINGN